jgi:hypothetical protein
MHPRYVLTMKQRLSLHGFGMEFVPDHLQRDRNVKLHRGVLKDKGCNLQ